MTKNINLGTLLKIIIIIGSPEFLKNSSSDNYMMVAGSEAELRTG
jgi:hypothetical protein